MRRPRSALATSAASLALGVLGLTLVACDAPSEPVGQPGAPGATPSATASTEQGGPSSASTPGDDTSTAPTSSGEPTDDAPSTPSEPTSLPTFGKTASDAPDAAGIPTTYDEARARVQDLRGGNSREMRRFSTPGDRIYCVLADPVLGTACELRSGFIDDADVCGGGVADAVGRIELIGAGAVPQCNTDTIREPGAPTVQPGSLVARGDVACAVEEIGVTCVRESREDGFFLAPGRYATFG